MFKDVKHKHLLKILKILKIIYKKDFEFFNYKMWNDITQINN